MKRFLFFACTILNYFVAQTQPVNGLVAYWPLNGNYNDAGPNNITGTNFGSTATTNYASAANSAMQFLNPGSAVPQYATVSSPLLNFGAAQDFSVVFSVYINSPIVHPGGLFDNNINSGGYAVWFWNPGVFPQFQFNFRNNSVGTTNGALALNVWKHVCAVRAGTQLKIYINGVLNASTGVGSSTPVYNLAPRFGTMTYTGYSPPHYNGHNGKLDEMRIYNRALTDLEIMGLSSTALPVKLTSFTGVNNNNTIKLNWQTQYEQNSSHYNIQRSTDGINFTNVSRVTAAGNSNNPLTYDHTDVLPASIKMLKTVYYRLQSVDIDGRFSFSQILAIQIDKTDLQLIVYPNPAKDLLQVQTGNGLAGNATLIITDAAGRQMYKKDILLQQGSNSIPVNISLFGAGIYYIRLINGSESHIKQFLKE